MPYRDLERRREYGREWMRRNPEKARAGMQRWRVNHPENHRAEGRAYYARNRERVNARIQAYHRANPDIVRAKSQRHRALRLDAAGSFTAREWKALVAFYGGRCAYCGEAGPVEADHRIPLSRGGTNAIENILPACRICNARKHRLTEAEFRARLAAEKRLARLDYDFSRVLIM